MAEGTFMGVEPGTLGLHALSVGCVTHDRYGHRVRAGGSVLYAARCWRALGLKTRMVAGVGEDFACATDLDGLDIVRSSSGRTLTFDNAAPRLVAGDAVTVPTTLLSDAWRCNDVFLLAPVFGEIDVGAWLAAVQAPLVGLVLQGLVRQAGEADERMPGGRRVLAREPPSELFASSKVGLVVLSQEDLIGLGPGRSAAILEAIRAVVPVVVVTRGAEGSAVHTPGATWQVGVAPARVVDSTGAGDTFAAAMLAGLAAGMTVPRAARLASAASSIVVEGLATDALEHLPARLHDRLNAVSVCARGC